MGRVSGTRWLTITNPVDGSRREIYKNRELTPERGGRMSDRQLGTVVIGGSQSSLAVRYYLKQRDRRS